MADSDKTIQPHSMNSLLADLRVLILSARKAVAHTVDSIQVVTSFEIGRRIVEHEQQGSERAEYGKALLKELSAILTEEFGRGFSRSNLEYMRKFYLTYRERLPEKSQMPSGKLPQTSKSQTPSDKLPIFEKTRTVSAQFTLSWSQYVFLIGINNADERSFYEIEAAENGWTLPELKRQFNSGLYERLALSRDKDGEFRMLNIEKGKKGMNNTISPFQIHYSPFSFATIRKNLEVLGYGG